MIALRNIENFVKLAEVADKIIGSEASWKVKCHCILNEVKPQVEETGIPFECFLYGIDPEEDVRDYVASLVESAKEYRKILRAVRGR